MLLTIKTTHSPATDLGYLLQKHPKRYQKFPLRWGTAHVFFPKAEQNQCIAALLLDIDPISLIKKARGHANVGFSLEQYVNDRPYVASSFLSMAIAKLFRSTLKGICKEKPELPETAIPLEVSIASLPCKSENGEHLLKSLFEPLGYEVVIQKHLLNEQYPEWGNAQHYTVTIKKTCFLKDLLSHIYVLIPVLDNEKHYWVTKDEIDKLLSYGKGWLNKHPKKELITSRYLKKQSTLTNEALARLLEEDEQATEEVEEKVTTEEVIEEELALYKQRMQAVMNVLKTHQARRIADLGCGEGTLLKLLLEDHSFDYILGVDVSYRTLERAKVKLKLDQLPPSQKKRIHLIQGSLNYTDKRIRDCDAMTLIEVIEHLDVPRLSTLESVVFGHAKPNLAIITTPNAEYNEVFENLPFGNFRHEDHRFEWTRNEFQSWSEKIASRFGYSVRFQPVGPEDKTFGPPTQMGIFTKQK